MIDKQKKEEEQEANWFAAALLMPQDLMEAYWHSLQDIESMAKLFGTSYSAMQWRLKNLGLND
jgi:Zn-dependent peptidase ImmA (M78 family)